MPPSKRKKGFLVEDFPRKQKTTRLSKVLNLSPNENSVYPPIKSLSVWPRKRSHSIDSLSDSDGFAQNIRNRGTTIANTSSTPCTTGSTRTLFPRHRSLSVDSLPDSIFSNGGGTSHVRTSTLTRTFDGVLITPDSSSYLPDPVYLTYRDEVTETHDLRIPGETRPNNRGTLPVRLLDHFTFYNENGVYLPFALVAASLLSATSQQYIRASGIVSRCLASGESEGSDSNESDILQAEDSPLVTLQPLKDFWTDYNTRQLDGVWGARTIGVATMHGWYILQQPAPLYTTYYQPFWLSHHLTWLAANSIRTDPTISFKTFCRQIECRNDDDAVSILGRAVSRKDITVDYVVLYMQDQLSSKKSVHDCTTLLKSPMLQYILHHADTIGQTLPQFLRIAEFNSLFPIKPEVDKSDVILDKALTITMPLVHELTTGLFLKTMLKAGKTLDSHDRENKLIQAPDTPDILHPDRPTNFDWGQAINGYPGYFRKIYLDGEGYRVGDVVMVNPGEDDLVHRAKSASEACSQSRKNKFVNKVWFCQIVYMFDKKLSSKKSSNTQKTEPTAHVQWYEHGSKTILQEIAHPYGLFALAECADIPIGSILGPCVVQHLKPGDEEPNDYHCSFLWDADEARFLDQASLQRPGTDKGPPRCSCCTFNDRRNRDTILETFIHSETSGEVRGIQYHKHDFVFIAEKPDHPYLIGQIRRFVVDKELTVQKSKVELTLLGRFDDIARTIESDIRQDETRLFLTDEVNTFCLPLIEGKCFVASKGFVTSHELSDHFYVDRWAPTRNVHRLEDLRSFKGHQLAACKPCTHAAKQKRDNVRAYMASNAPLRTMELFAGAGGLSTGLEQSTFVKTFWAVEILPVAAATFQANHPDAIVYNQDTNICLQNAINAREGKHCEPLRSIADRKQLPPMPQRGDVELITGGFPCQSFSGMNHQRHKSHEDIRTTLVANMLSYVEFYEPRYVLMENVKGLLQHHSQGSVSEMDDSEDDEDKVIKMSIVKFVLRALLRLGYQTQFKVLQAADYGSPQRRERVIFWAARRSEVLPAYPLPTHVAPQFRCHTLSLPTRDKLFPVQRSDQNCAPFRALIVADAISDLPGFDWKNPHVVCSEDDSEVAEDTLRRRKQYPERTAVSSHLRRLVGFLEPVNYASPPRTRYQRIVRGDNEQLTLHCSRTFSAAIVERVWHICSQKVNGPRDLPYELWTPALLKVSRDVSKLNSKWQQQFSRLKWREPFNTALTSCRPFSKGSKVLHPLQKRIITARECARSQGFPDSYQFVQQDENSGPAAWVKVLDDIYRQIGNAVPVPLAHALGKSLGEALVAQWLRERGSENMVANEDFDPEDDSDSSESSL